MEEKDLHYLAVLGTRKNAVAQLDLIVRAASSSAEDQRAADMVREMICDGPIQLDSVLFDVLDAVGKGFSATEIIWNTVWERMVSCTIEVARPALVRVRLDLGRRDTGAHPEGRDNPGRGRCGTGAPDAISGAAECTRR